MGFVRGVVLLSVFTYLYDHSVPNCCILQLQFAADEGSGVEHKYEWVYRGSTRLLPLCNEVIRRKVSVLVLVEIQRHNYTVSIV